MKFLVRTIFGLMLSAVVTAVYVLLGRFQHGAPKRYPRRTFVRNTVLGSVGLSLAAMGGGFLAFFWPLKTGAFGTEITVPGSLIPAVGDPPYVDQAGKFFLINNEDGVLALYWKCPHLGCTVPWNDSAGDFQCPCHGSVYDRTGVLISGPAPRPMDLMELTPDGQGNLIVNTGEITERSSYDPSQATQI
jgi:cytochrome b6-f complex iron-sulfur subunit